MRTSAIRMPIAAMKISARGSFLRDDGWSSRYVGSLVPANPVYPTSSGSTAPMTLPVPNSWTLSLLIDVSPSVTWMSYVPSGDISFRIFSSPARMFCL